MADYLSFEEYAEVTGLTLERIEELIKRGEIRVSIDTDGSKCIYYDGPGAEIKRMKEQAVIEAAEQEHENAVAKISLSTLASLPGNKEFTVIDVVTAECVYGMNIFRDAFAAFRDVVGGRNDASEKVLKDLKQTCLTELREEALKIGAEAVIGVDLDYSEFSGGGKSMLFLVASGTAVKVSES